MRVRGEKTIIEIQKALCISCSKCVKDCVTHNIILKSGNIASYNSDHLYELRVSEKILYKKRHRESCPYCKGRRLKK